MAVRRGAPAGGTDGAFAGIITELVERAPAAADRLAMARYAVALRGHQPNPQG